MISISVIIVNFNARYFLKSCIESILESQLAQQFEVIVVDNNSSDGSVEMLRKDYPQVTCIANKENFGFSKANNQGAKIAQGMYLLVLNPDTLLQENTLSEFLSFAEQQNDFGAAGVRFIDGSGEYLPESKRNFPTLKVAGSKLLGYSKLYYANHIGRDQIAAVDILTGAFMFIKKEAYDEVGGFDEDFFMYGEDIDLSYRLVKAGYKNFYLGTSRILHFKGESTVKDQFYLKNFYGALGIFYKKHFPDKKWLYNPIDLLINGLIFIKSIGITEMTSQDSRINSFLLIGEDHDFYSELVKKVNPLKSNISRDLDASAVVYDYVFIDRQSKSHSEIIEIIGNPKLFGTKKRIVSRDHDYFIGSDRSDKRGQVVEL